MGTKKRRNTNGQMSELRKCKLAEFEQSKRMTIMEKYYSMRIVEWKVDCGIVLQSNNASVCIAVQCCHPTFLVHSFRFHTFLHIPLHFLFH